MNIEQHFIPVDMRPSVNKKKQSEHDAIERQTAEFLANGGRIERIEGVVQRSYQEVLNHNLKACRTTSNERLQ